MMMINKKVNNSEVKNYELEIFIDISMVIISKEKLISYS